MVKGLADNGLRVVMDVVYNHTSAAGQSDTSVLDRIVPGYYHRLSLTGAIETSTCCPNTAAEHAMMEKLMIDSLVTWTKAYKVDGFRFDLMGHHPKSTLLAIRAALDALTPAADGIDGSAIYLYGEGWNFGEVANNTRFEQATQSNMSGTGIGTFSDRLRDGVRGGNPFSDVREQGFINGLYYDPNAMLQGTPGEQLANLLHRTDWIRVGLAGDLRDFEFIDTDGNWVRADQVDYFGQQAGYTADPQENIKYVAAHDYETLFDATQLKAPVATSMDDRVRIQNLGNSIVLLGQGVPFFHAGQEILRSKSMDRDSYDSGDWFNQIDWTLTTTNWGHGLPIAEKNQDKWPIMQPLLADPALVPVPYHLDRAYDHLRELLAIRRSSELFRLETAEDVKSRLRFHNTGPGQVPGLIVMSLDDPDATFDRGVETILALFNAGTSPVDVVVPGTVGRSFELHPVLEVSSDPVVASSTFDESLGEFGVPARTTAVFWAAHSIEEQFELLIADIDRLKAEGLLNRGRANALRKKVVRAFAKYRKGREKAAARQLGAFVRQVRAFMRVGILPADEGQALIDAARVLIRTVRS
jgi:pullulanase-type alpha-1,6-glucosidase